MLNLFVILLIITLFYFSPVLSLFHQLFLSFLTYMIACNLMLDKRRNDRNFFFLIGELHDFILGMICNAYIFNA